MEFIILALAAPTEHCFKEITRGAITIPAPRPLTRSATACADTIGSSGRRREIHPCLPVCAQLVEVPALLRIGEHLVRFVNLLESILRRLVAGINIGVELSGELPECTFDLILASAPGNTEDLVIIAELDCHWRIPPIRY